MQFCKEMLNIFTIGLKSKIAILMSSCTKAEAPHLRGFSNRCGQYVDEIRNKSFYFIMLKGFKKLLREPF